MKVMKLFTDHPASVDETYAEHFIQSSGFGTRMIAGGVCCLLHGILPFTFVTTGSSQIKLLHERMVTNRNRKAAMAKPPANAGWDYCI